MLANFRTLHISTAHKVLFVVPAQAGTQALYAGEPKTKMDTGFRQYDGQIIPENAHVPQRS